MFNLIMELRQIRIFIPALLFNITLQLNAQFYPNEFYSTADVTEEQRNYAVSLKKKYPMEDAVIDSSVIEFRYYESSRDGIKAEQSIMNEFISLRIDHSIDRVHFYDEYSYLNSYSASISGTVKDENIFYDDRKFCSYSYSFNQVGQKRRENKTKTYTDIKYLTTYYLSDIIPIKYRKVIISIPKWLDVQIVESNFDKYSIEKTINEQSDGSKQIIYEISDVEPMKELEYVRSSSFVYPQLLFIPKRFNPGSRKQRNILNSKDDLYSWYRLLLDENDYNSEKVRDFTRSLVKKCKSEKEKIRTIFYWVQDNIRYIAFEDGLAGFKPDSPESVFNNMYGDCKGMANLLKAMLVHTGFDARLTWLGTKSVRYDYSNPSLASDNHMICTVFLNGKKLYLDATDKYNKLGGLDESIQGRQVLIEDGANYIFDSIPVFNNDVNEYIEKFELNISNSDLAGKTSFLINGEYKKGLLSLYHSVQAEYKEDLIKYLLNGKENVRFSNLKISNLENRDSTIKISSEIEIEHSVLQYDNEIYISIDPFSFEKLASFDENRNNEIYFGTKIKDHRTIVFHLPDNMKLKYKPENMFFENDYFSAAIQIKVSADKVIVDKTLQIPYGFVPIEMKEVWNQLVTDLSNRNSDHLIFTQQ